MTRQQWKERLPLIQAFVDGKDIAFQNETMHDVSFELHDVSFEFPPHAYKIIEPPKRVPWDCIEDVKLDAWYRRIDDYYTARIAQIKGTIVWLRGASFTIDYLAINHQWSTDLKTWHPCTKEVGGAK